MRWVGEGAPSFLLPPLTHRKSGNPPRMRGGPACAVGRVRFPHSYKLTSSSLPPSSHVYSCGNRNDRIYLSFARGWMGEKVQKGRSHYRPLPPQFPLRKFHLAGISSLSSRTDSLMRHGVASYYEITKTRLSDSCLKVSISFCHFHLNHTQIRVH